MSGETEAQVSGWTTDTLKMHLESRLEDLRRALDERFATQTKATDKAFDAQQAAMRTAFDAADKAVQAALAAAEKAAAKAESSAKDRFEAVNEFRGQLSDVIATFLPRTEYSTAHKALEDQVHSNADRLAALELRLTSRLDLGQGNLEGTARHVEQRQSASAATVQWVIMAVLALGVIVAVIIPLLVH